MNNNVEFIEESFEYESDVRVNERNCGSDYGNDDDDDDNKSENKDKGESEGEGNKGEEMNYGINACESMRTDKEDKEDKQQNDDDSVKEFGEGIWEQIDEDKEEEEEKKSSYEEKKSDGVNDSCSEIPSLENIDLGMSRNDGMSVKEEEKKNEKKNVIYNGFLRSEESGFHIEVNPNANNNNNNGEVIQNKNELAESNISIDKFNEDNDKIENTDNNENDKIYNENVNKSIDIQDIESSFNDNDKQNEESCKDNNNKTSNDDNDKISNDNNDKDIIKDIVNDDLRGTEDKDIIVNSNNDKIENSRYNDNMSVENNRYSQNIIGNNTNNKSKSDSITKVSKSIQSNKISISTTNKSKLKETQTSQKKIIITNTNKTSTTNISTTNTNNNKSDKRNTNTNLNSTNIKHPLPTISTTNIKPTFKKPNNFRSVNLSHSSSPFLPLSKSTSIPTPTLTKPITSSSSSTPHTYLSPHSFQTPPSLHKDITPLITSIFPTNTSLQSFKSSLDILPLSSNQLPSNTIGPLQYEPSTQFNLRKVKADGNCFYRSFLFSLLEQIIFTNNISFLLSILHDLKSRIDSLPSSSSSSTAIFPSLISKYKIDIDTTYKCLLTLLIALKSSSSNTTHKAYTILIKMYNNIPHFDLGLICYMHTLIYDYIHLNERNYYSKQFDVPFGNLLPKECEGETDTSRSTKWNYEKFYNDYLYKLYVDAEKIIIYVCPFIFNVNVNINVNGDNMVLSINDDNSNSNTMLNVFLLYRKSHYDVLYEGEFFLKNKDRLCLHFFSDETNKSQQSSLNKIKTCIVCNKSKNIYSLNKTIIICERCMIKELSCSITEQYRTFITNNRKYFLKQFLTSQHILNTIQSTTLVINCNSSATAVTIKECIDSLTQRNNSLTFDRFIYDSKCKQCLVCDACCKDGERKLRLKLPCECRVDKVECVEMYYDYIKATLPLKQRIECYCGFVYSSYRYIVELINVMEECGVKCDDIVEYYASVVKMNCVICNKEYNRKEDVMYCVMKVSGVKVNTMMKHAVCNACIKKSKEKKVDLVGVGIRCKMCLKEHYILKNNKLEM